MTVPTSHPDKPGTWSPAEVLAHLYGTFQEAERYAPDAMDRYSGQLAEADNDDERLDIMRRGLRETIDQRFPLHDSSQQQQQGNTGHVTDGH